MTLTAMYGNFYVDWSQSRCLKTRNSHLNEYKDNLVSEQGCTCVHVYMNYVFSYMYMLAFASKLKYTLGLSWRIFSLLDRNKNSACRPKKPPKQWNYERCILCVFVFLSFLLTIHLHWMETCNLTRKIFLKKFNIWGELFLSGITLQ